MAKKKSVQKNPTPINFPRKECPAPKSSPWIMAVFIVMLAPLTAATVDRNAIYQTPVTLWRATAAIAHTKQRPHENYGQSLSTAGSLVGDPVIARRYYEEALREFQTVESMPNDGSVPMRDLYREFGVVYFRLELLDDAIAAWKKGLMHAPMDPGIMNNLSVAHMKKGLFDEAGWYAEQALRVNPYMPTLLNTMGEVSMRRGDFDKALEYFKRSIQLNPDDSSQLWNAAIASEQIGRDEDALVYTKRYMSRAGNPPNGQALLDHLTRKANK
jgi:tetratricopeptide (TPR) repeat protein